MLAQAAQHPEDAALWMNLSTVMFCLSQYDIGMSIRAQALQLQRIYHLPATLQPAKFRLLLLMVPGDLAANTPLDCLLENSDVELIFYYLSDKMPFAQPIPEHDAVFVALSDSDEYRDTLIFMGKVLASWPRPVINAPQNIPATGRNTASMLLQNAPGLLMPMTFRIARSPLLAIAAGTVRLAELYPGCDFPVILRPYGSQAGIDLERIESPEQISSYLDRVQKQEFFISRFIDYRGADQLYRKYRIVLIDGAAYACHMAISENWMIHYVNAGMYENAQKREEEAAFMEHFQDFAQRHRAALQAVYQRIGLDYLCIDCAQTQDGQLLIFELDHIMVVHAMDPEEQFPYKKIHIQKVQQAFRDFIFRRAASFSLNNPTGIP